MIACSSPLIQFQHHMVLWALPGVSPEHRAWALQGMFPHPPLILLFKNYKHFELDMRKHVYVYNENNHISCWTFDCFLIIHCLTSAAWGISVVLRPFMCNCTCSLQHSNPFTWILLIKSVFHENLYMRLNAELFALTACRNLLFSKKFLVKKKRAHSQVKRNT